MLAAGIYKTLLNDFRRSKALDQVPAHNERVRLADTTPPASSQSPSQRRVRVSMLVEEEGLRYGTIARIAYWLGVSPSTIRRDIAALTVAGDPAVVSAAVTQHRTPGKRRALGHS